VWRTILWRHWLQQSRDGDDGDLQSQREPRCRRSSRANSARVGVPMPEALASRAQTPRARNRRVVGWLVTETDPEKIAQRQRIFGAPGDAALRVDAFEVANPAAGSIPDGNPGRPVVSA